MIRLNSFLHCQQLADIIGRWMMDQLAPEDVRVLKELVNFNCYVAPYVLDDVASYIFLGMAGPPVESFVASTKGRLKDFMVEHPPYRNGRIDQLIAQYRKYPQDFYRETPFDARIYHHTTDDGVQYLGATRRKRFRRIAEKSARRIIDHVYHRIKEEAETLARERASQLSVPIHQLITPADQQVEEFAHAERRIIKRIRTGQLWQQIPPLDINDVLGIKAMVEDDDVQRLTGLLEQHPRLAIVETELHSGAYTAINITLRYTIDKPALLRHPPTGSAFDQLVARGIAPDRVVAGYRQFVTEADDALVLELIVSTYQNGLESEIGRSMHEERVLNQRAQQQYRGSLARNITALLDYMMALRRYPEDQIDAIPIKLWIRYMPDYFQSVMKATYDIKESAYLGP